MSFASGMGLMSGINFSEIISGLRQANSRPIFQIQSQQQRLQAQGAAMQLLGRLTDDFKSKVDSLSKPESFIRMSASTSDTAALTTTASSTAAVGSYSVQVRQLAQSARVASQGLDSAQARVADAEGSFQYRVGDGELKSIAVNAGTSLADLRDAINAAGGGVRASIVSDGTPTLPARLVLSAEATGAANELKITRNDTLLNFATPTVEEAVAGTTNKFDGTVTSGGSYTGAAGRNVIVEISSAGAVGTAGFRVSLDGGLSWSAADAFTTSATPVDVTGTAAEGIEIAFGAGATEFAVGDRFTIDTFVPVLQQARDAIIEVDGIAISRATNEFTEAIEGVTLTARKVSESAATVTVSNQKAQIGGQVKEFVDAYNMLATEIARQTAYNVDAQVAAPLFGDSGPAGLLSGLRSTLGQAVKGLDDKTTTLSALGISFGRDGKLALDLTKLNKALDEDSDAVARLFVESGRATSSSVKLHASGKETGVGEYGVVVTQAASQARVVGTRSVGPEGLAQSETLSFIAGEQSMNVTLSAGMTLAQAIVKINTQLGDNGYELRASDEGGRLAIHSVEYGSSEKFSIHSNLDAGLGFGIGTATIEAVGTDVAGRIGGMLATGKGQVLKASPNGPAAGLELLITAGEPMNTSFTLSRGIAWELGREIASATDSKTGLFSVRAESIDKRMKDYDKRIQTLQSRLDKEETRMRAQFTALEQKLASMQSQGSFLTAQLSQIIR